MPLYSYQCQHCQKEYDAFATMDDRDTQTCECGSTDVTRPFKKNQGRASMKFDLIVEHLYDEPKRFTSRKELRKACAKEGVSCSAID